MVTRPAHLGGHLAHPSLDRPCRRAGPGRRHPERRTARGRLPPDNTTKASAAPGVSSYRITLVTGDRLLVTREPGRPDRVVFQPVPGSRSTSAVTTRWGDHTLVVPSAAAADVRSGRLDRSLFDVHTLIAQRYDDKRSATLPVIVEYAGTKATANSRAGSGPEHLRDRCGSATSRPSTSRSAHTSPGCRTPRPGSASRASVARPVAGCCRPSPRRTGVRPMCRPVR